VRDGSKAYAQRYFAADRSKHERERARERGESEEIKDERGE
jgi:hypothetical protein